MQIREIIPGSEEYELEVQLRDRILRKPLGLSISVEGLSEGNDIHLGAFDGAQLLGCLVLTPLNDDDIKMRQVAVVEAAQGQGIGRLLVVASEKKATELGFRRLVMNARETAIPFYLNLGYEVFGESFTEVTIPHRKMRKDLN